jgi:hypothetical protein
MRNPMLLPMRLQFFADADTGAGGGGAGAGEGASGAPGGAGQPAAGAPAFDYDKLAGLINGKQAVTEDTGFYFFGHII